jgi:hypothetical protein
MGEVDLMARGSDPSEAKALPGQVHDASKDMFAQMNSEGSGMGTEVQKGLTSCDFHGVRRRELSTLFRIPT